MSRRIVQIRPTAWLNSFLVVVAIGFLVVAMSGATQGNAERLGVEGPQSCLEKQICSSASVSISSVSARGYAVEVSDGTVEIDREQQVLRYYHTAACDLHTVRLALPHITSATAIRSTVPCCKTWRPPLARSRLLLAGAA